MDKPWYKSILVGGFLISKNVLKVLQATNFEDIEKDHRNTRPAGWAPHSLAVFCCLGDDFGSKKSHGKRSR